MQVFSLYCINASVPLYCINAGLISLPYTYKLDFVMRKTRDEGELQTRVSKQVMWKSFEQSSTPRARYKQCHSDVDVLLVLATLVIS